MDKKLLLSIKGENRTYANLDDILVDRDRIWEIQRRTFNSVLKELKSGKVWLQFETKNIGTVGMPYLACAEGCQGLSAKLLKRIFEEVDLVRMDYVKGSICDGVMVLGVYKWTWRIDGYWEY